MSKKDETMATLTVFKFLSSGGARAALTTVEDLQRQELVNLHVGAVPAHE
jgi:uncharacterized membrane protein